MPNDARPPFASSAAPASGSVRVDADGVRTLKARPRRTVIAWIALAVAVPIAGTLIAVAVIRLAPVGRAAVRREPAARAPEPDVITVPPPAAAPPRAAAQQKLVPKRVTVVEQTAPDAARPGTLVETAPPKPRREIDAAEVITALREEGETGGIAAFGLPGSDPPKAGIIVPEEYDLPEGYVRHYQSTDDGRQLPAILMFHPDYQFMTETGEPVALPSDRVVPPEMVPPGMRIEMLDPKANAPDSPS
jgi:hypothetical protein